MKCEQKMRKVQILAIAITMLLTVGLSPIVHSAFVEPTSLTTGAAHVSILEPGGQYNVLPSMGLVDSGNITFYTPAYEHTDVGNFDIQRYPYQLAPAFGLYADSTWNNPWLIANDMDDGAKTSEEGMVIHETVNGIYSWTGANYTGSTNTTLTNSNPDYFPTIKVEMIPTPIHMKNGTAPAPYINLTWTGLREEIEDHWFLGPPTWTGNTNNIVNYSVYRSTDNVTFTRVGNSSAQVRNGAVYFNDTTVSTNMDYYYRIAVNYRYSVNGGTNCVDSAFTVPDNCKYSGIYVTTGRSNSSQPMKIIVPPDVINTVPMNAATAVPVNQVVSVFYDAQMDTTGGLEPTLTQTGGTDPGGWTFGGWFSGDTEAQWTHNDWTVSEELVTMQVTGGQDPFGNPVVTDPYIWSFTIADIVQPDVQSTDPANAATGVAPTQVVSVIYTEDMDATGGLEPTLTQTGGTDPGGWTFDGWFTGNTEARWSHNAWTSEDTVTLQVSGGVDPAGNPVLTDPFSWTFDIADVIQPDVQNTIPANAATGVVVGQVISVIYTEAMDTTGGLEPILTQIGGTDPGGWTFDGWFTGDTEAQWSHNAWTVSEEMITMQVTGGFDPAGNPVLTDPYSWSFTIADLVAPDVSATTPIDTATDVPVNQIVSVFYDEDMDITPGNEPTLTQVGGTDPGGWTFDGWFTGNTEARWSHNDWTVSEELVTMQVTGGLDPVGFPVVTDPFQWSFTIADIIQPDVQSTTPADVAIGVAPGTTVIVTYTEPLDTLINTPILTQTGGTDPGGWVFAGWFTGDTEMRWNHNNWQSEDVVQLTVSGGQDPAGNPVFTDPYIWSFTIADVIDPDVMNTVPVNTATAVPVNQVVSVFYDESMDTTGGMEPTLTQIGGTDPGGWTFDGWFTGDTEARWSHNDWTVSEELITLQVTGGVDPVGNPVVTDPYQWSFNVADIIAPDVSGTVPANLATAVPVNQVVSVFYDEAMDTTGGLEPTLTQIGGTDPGGWTFDGWFTGDTEARWSHNDWTVSEELVTMQVTGGVDPEGNPVITDPHQWSFTIADIIPPDVQTTTPLNAAVGVAVNQQVSVFYTEAMDTTGGLEPTLTQIGGTDPGGWTFDGWFTGDTEARWSHNDWTVSEELITLQVTGGVDPVGFPVQTDPFQWSFTIADIIAPDVSGTVPANTATAVSVNQVVSVFYDEAMDTTGGMEPTLTQIGGTDPGGWTFDGWFTGDTEARWSHNDWTVSEELVTMQVTGGIDPVGFPVVTDPFQWSFTIADIIAPDVQLTSPANGATGVAVGVNVIVTYTEDMDSSGANDPVLAQTGGTDPGGWAFLGWFNGDTEARWSHNPWNTGETITLEVSGGADPEGNAVFTDPYSWNFDVADAPDVLNTVPTNGATAVLVNQVITVTYTKAMDTTGGLEPTLTQIGGTDPGGWTFDGWFNGDTEARWSHNDWTVSEDFITMQVTGGQDTVANAVVTDPYQWSFTIADLIAPDVTGTNPANAATGVGVNQVISVFYDEDMDTTGGLEPIVTQIGGTDPGGWAFLGWFTGGTEARWGHNDWTASEELITMQVTGGVDPEGNPVVTDPYSWSFTIDDIISPDVANTVPVNAATAIPVGQIVSVFYDEDMDTTGGLEPTLTQTGGTDPGGWAFLGWFTGDTEARWSHNNWLFSEEVITLQVVSGVDPVGNPVVTDPFIWSFTVADIIDPDIANTNPTNGATGVAVNQVVSVFYDEDMDTTVGSRPTLTQTAGTDPGGWTFVGWFTGNTEARWSHNAWTSGDVITLRVTGGVDPEGNPVVTSPYSWTFTIADVTPPTIQSTTPVDGATGVLINADIVIIFSESINQGTFAFSCAPNPGGWNPPVWVGGNIVTLTHTNDFLAYTPYTITVTVANDMAGNPLAAGVVPNPWSFTTGDAVLWIVIEDINGNPIGDMNWLTTDNDTERFFSQGYGSSGYVGNVSVNWALTGGIGLLNITTGISITLDCATPGTGLIVAYNAAGTLIDITGILTVGLGALIYELSPNGTTITADETHQFTAIAHDADNNVDPSVMITWDAEDGTIDINGLFTPMATGTWNISADFGGGIVVNATIIVIAGALAEILISPTDTTITMDDTQQYTITGEDANGNAVTIAAADIDWDAQDGAISNTGLYTPASLGNWKIFVIVGGVLNTTTVTVLAGGATQIVIDQTGIEMTADDTQQFTVTFLDAFGNPTTSTVTVLWASSNGTIVNGLFTPWNSGTITIWANGTGLTGDSVQVIVTAGTVTTIVITPTDGSGGTRATDLRVGDSLLFTAEALDWAGNPVPVAPSLLAWTTTIGTVSNGFFTAPTILTGGAQFAAGVLTVTYDDGATVVVSTEDITALIDILNHLEIVDPTPTERLEAGDYRTFTVIGYDIYNNVIDPANVSVTWTVNFGEIDATGGQLHATEEGIIEVTAESVNGVRATYSTYVPRPDTVFTSWLWLVIVLLVVVLILIVLLIIGRRRVEPPEEEEEEMEETLVPVGPPPTAEVPEEFKEPIKEPDVDEETAIDDGILDDDLGELEDLAEPVKVAKPAPKPKVLTPEEKKEQERIARCEKMLSAADIMPEDKERLKLLIPSGISALEFTNEVKEAIAKRKKKEEEKDFSADEKASLLEEELAAELAELEDELGEEDEDDDLEERILQEIEDLEDL